MGEVYIVFSRICGSFSYRFLGLAVGSGSEFFLIESIGFSCKKVVVREVRLGVKGICVG